MKREDEYRQLARDVLRRASEEESAQLTAQWEILGARYMELASQSNNSDDDQSHLMGRQAPKKKGCHRGDE